MEWLDGWDAPLIRGGRVNRDLFHTHREANEFAELLREWIDSGRQSGGGEAPLRRRLDNKTTPACSKVLSRYLKNGALILQPGIHPSLVEHNSPLAKRLNRGEHVGLVGSFRMRGKSDYLGYMWTLFYDSPLSTQVHICRNCKKFFVGKPKQRPYSHGRGCSAKCRSKLTLDAGRLVRRAELLLESHKLYRKAQQNLPRKEFSNKNVSEYIVRHADPNLKITKTFISRNWDPIVEGRPL
jgi:hypothetical protein